VTEPLPQQLRHVREELGWSREKLTGILGATTRRLMFWETGRNQPSAADLTVWAAALGKTLALVDADGPAPSPLPDQRRADLTNTTLWRLRLARESLRPPLTQAALASHLGVSSDALRNWETARSQPTRGDAQRWAEALGVEL
jgi:transcriptional regulator with XRE-family HTH domain